MLNNFDLKDPSDNKERINDFWNTTEPTKYAYDLEDVPIFRAHKINQIEEVLQRAIDTKYKISLFKGFRMFYQSFILFLLTCSLVLRGDIFAVMYLVFVIRLMTVKPELTRKMMVRLCMYCAGTILFTYFVTVLNLTDSFSPIPMPSGLEGYPKARDTTD